MDSSSLNLSTFHAIVRIAYLLLAGVLAYSVARGTRRPVPFVALLSMLLLGWIGSNYPLERIYGLMETGDRARNLAWCMSVAAGNSPLSTGVLGQTSLEPFWATLVAALSFFSPERVLRIYPWLSPAILIGFASTVYYNFRRSDLAASSDDLERETLALAVAAFATLFATAPLDYLGPYRGYWARTFLLKPNHAVGLILIPIVVGALAKGTGRDFWKPGLWMALLSLAFVVHWVFLCFSLLVYLGLTLLLQREALRDEAKRVGLAVLLSALFVSPALYLLVVYQPHAFTWAAGADPEFPMRSDWGDIMPRGVSFLFLVTLDQGIVFYLGLLGLVLWLRGRGRAALLWASVMIAAYLLWGANYYLYSTARAREADEFYFFLVFAQSVAAGYGAYRVLKFAARVARTAGERSLAFSFACGFLVMAPLGFPYWWEPAKMDAHFRRALDPLPPEVTELAEWIRQTTRGTDVFVAGNDLFQWIASLTGRQVHPPSPETLDGLRVVARSLGDPEAQRAAASLIPAHYVVWNAALARELETREDLFENVPGCREVYRGHSIRVYELQPDDN